MFKLTNEVAFWISLKLSHKKIFKTFDGDKLAWFHWLYELNFGFTFGGSSRDYFWHSLKSGEWSRALEIDFAVDLESFLACFCSSTSLIIVVVVVVVVVSKNQSKSYNLIKRIRKQFRGLIKSYEGAPELLGHWRRTVDIVCGADLRSSSKRGGPS